MKLYKYTSSRFAIVLFVLLTIWAAIFYLSMLDEIYDSLEDGLENQKLLVMQQAEKDSMALQKKNFEDGYYKIQEITYQKAMEFRDIYKDTLMYVQYEEDLEPFRMLKSAFELDGKYYEVQIITSMVEEDDLIANLFFSLIILYVGLMISLNILNNFLLKKTWRPFFQLLQWLQKFKLDDPLPIKKVDTGIEEFQLLNDTVIKLLKRNIEVYNDQKQFIENASHEIQTPLAISFNKLEILVEKFDHSEDELKIIASVMNNLQRLSKLNKSLLLLSKIHNKQFSEESEVDVNLLLEKVVEDFSDQARYKNIDLALLTKGKCLQWMHTELAHIMVSNIIKNAIVHNRAGGYVNITVDRNSLIVENSGLQQPLNSQEIFDRFYKGKNSESSTGLGLAITKAIADLYGFSIQYNYQQKHVITIIF